MGITDELHGRERRPDAFLGMRGGQRTGNPEQGVGGAQRRGQEQDAARQPQHALSGAAGIFAHDVEDTLRQRAATQGHRQGRRLRPCRDQRQRPGIFQPVAAERERDLVTAEFAFGADAPVQPPQGGMIEEQHLGQYLEEVHKGIEPPDMGQFVRDHRTQLLFGKRPVMA